MREYLCLTYSVVVSNKWTLNSLDVKTGILKGKAKNKLHMLELQKKPVHTNKVWKLTEMHIWTCRGKQVLVLEVEGKTYQTGSLTSTFQWSVKYFLTKEYLYGLKNRAIGIVACFVDNVLWGGNEEFLCVHYKAA